MIGQVLRAGIEVLIDDGRVRLSVQEIEEAAHGAVFRGARSARTRASTCRDWRSPSRRWTPKDFEDLDWAIETGVDYVALSFVRSAKDVRSLKTYLEEHGSPAWVISKIEKARRSRSSTTSSTPPTR